MNIVMVASEVVPFAKTGGLADVAGTLPLALARSKETVSIIMPFYDRRIDAARHGIKALKPAMTLSIPMGDAVITGKVLTATLKPNVNVYFISQPSYYGRPDLYQTPEGDYPDNAQRFIFFSRASVEVMLKLGLKPDIVHAHDWQAALVPVYLKSLYADEKAFRKTRSLLTIHNLGYQGMFSKELMPLTGLGWEYFTFTRLEYWDRVGFLKGGILYADAISTVSPRYAKEIMTPEQGLGLEGTLAFRSDDLSGILNGIDYDEWNPAIDRFLPRTYTPRELGEKSFCKDALCKKFGLKRFRDTPVIGMVGRLTSQKGFDIFVDALFAIMRQKVQLAILGTGEARYHDLLTEAVAKYPGRIGLKLTFDNELAHLVEAGSDFFLMPSRYEPCGLNQMISLKYGTIPIVRATGGLDDAIEDYNPRTGKGNGFKFANATPDSLYVAIRRALELYEDRKAFEALQRAAMGCDFSWNRSAKQYRALYRRMAASPPAPLPR